ncbi:hypothetical protein C8R43DRAFT_1143270 [Mycena crocata]|nr:hypothetical protein C8R43DRAFT_1143270 [Mycena crocata]
MPPLPLLLSACICTLQILSHSSTSTVNTIVPMASDPSGTLKFRSTRLVDTAVGFDEADALDNVSADKAVYISNDGMRRADELLNIGQKKRRLDPTDLKDPLANWMPVDDKAFVNDKGVVINPDALDDMDKVSGLDTKKRYDSSDNPMAKWREMKQFFLDESVRRDGLGDAIHGAECLLCQKPVGPDAPGAPRFFRCQDCGDFLQCKQCCIDRHQPSPLHLLEEWGGSFWKKTTLLALGLVYQVGHEGGPCKRPLAPMRTMVVIHTTGIHSVHFHYCGCRRRVPANELEQLMRGGWYPASVTDPGTCATFKVLDLFRLLNVVGNVNVHDFIRSLERLTDGLGPSGMQWMPDRYTAFARMQRQSAFVTRVRRAGRAHAEEGVEATAPGETVPRCWACPQDLRNLPPDWREVDPKYRFLYMLLLAVDANFKLKNRLRANERFDPSLGPGWGAFVEPEGYKEHLKGYVGENDISTCIAFAALLQKDTRLTTGLRTSGVGGCVCARHECLRPNGLGDLQKGERYANMDYIVMSCLAGITLLALTISYDIACQWKKKLRERNAKLPTAIQLDVDKINIQCGLPVWHASSHEAECSNQNSLSFLVGVGKTDGEGIERVWAALNPMAYATKEMGPGNRADTIDDKIDSHNFLKNLGQVDALRRKLVVSLAERARQVESFKEVNKTVTKELRAEWQSAVDAFVADHDQPNPYILKEGSGESEVQIRLNLRLSEEEEARKSGTPLHGTSATAFLVAGIQLEDAQRRILSDLAGGALVSADRASKIQDRRVAFFKKLSKFRQLQQIFTPGAARAVAEEELERNEDSAPVKAELVRLYMPSELSDWEQQNGCQRGLVKMEVALREAQCRNALAAVRKQLHGKRHLIGFRNSYIAGQGKATKARTVIDQVGERVEASAAKYRQGRVALENLVDEDGVAYLTQMPHFKDLKPSHLTLDNEVVESDTAARKKLSLIAAGKGSRNPRHIQGSSKRVMAWIWTAQGALGKEEEELHKSMRVEWCRAKARKVRWEEEVLLLREEMRRVLRYLEWQAEWWVARRDVRQDATPELRHGLAAYALRHANIFGRLGGFFQNEWSLSVGAIARSVVEEVEEDEGAELVQLFSQVSVNAAAGDNDTMATDNV